MTDDWPPEVIAQVNADRELGERVRAVDPSLFEEFAEVLFRHDPIGINFESNTDEYEAEVGTLIPRMIGATSPSDVERLLAEELDRWFAPIEVARDRLAAPAAELWSLWQARDAR